MGPLFSFSRNHSSAPLFSLSFFPPPPPPPPPPVGLSPPPSSLFRPPFPLMAEKGQPLPKFGEWDVNDPASAEGFTVIFNKARNEKKTGGKPDSPGKDNNYKNRPATATLGKPQSKKWFCCISAPAEK